MQKNTSAQTDEGANASTNQSRRDAHTEYVLRFTQRGKGAQELGVERQVQGHGACELASAATLADEPTDSHVNHAARGTASHEKRERRAAAPLRTSLSLAYLLNILHILLEARSFELG